MRAKFFDMVLAAALDNPDLTLITGDLGFGCVEPLVAARPGQFINAGVAEQNMTGLAAGIALAGGKVFTYSIANFPTLRCLEQIRNDVAYHQADVTIVAVGGGLSYGQLGMSHHATEDLAIMRAIPGLAVAAPGDPVETEAVLADLLAHGGPAYLRLGRAGEPNLHPAPLELRRGGSVELRRGDGSIAILCTGGILENAVLATDLLAQTGTMATLRSFPWLDPIDSEAIRDLIRSHVAVVTVEEHSIVGGLGSIVAEIIAETPRSATLCRMAIPATYSSVVGDQQYLRSIYGLDPAAIAARAQKHFEESYGTASQIR